MADLEDLKERVAESCRVLGSLDLTKAATGHVSTRVPGTDRVLIRARGPDADGRPGWRAAALWKYYQELTRA